jgi:hypothetical protein
MTVLTDIVLPHVNVFGVHHGLSGGGRPRSTGRAFSAREPDLAVIGIHGLPSNHRSGDLACGSVGAAYQILQSRWCARGTSTWRIQ